jgi:hypothetical protein
MEFLNSRKNISFKIYFFHYIFLLTSSGASLDTKSMNKVN